MFGDVYLKPTSNANLYFAFIVTNSNGRVRFGYDSSSNVGFMQSWVSQSFWCRKVEKGLLFLTT